jgi:hypothetical protein
MNKEITIKESEIQEIVLSGLKEKIATRYTYEIVDNMVRDVMNEEKSQEKLKKFVRETLSFLTNDKQFEKAVKEEFQHKVAKSMVGKLEGTVEKAVDILRQDPTLRAEMVLAIEKIIKKP